MAQPRVHGSQYESHQSELNGCTFYTNAFYIKGPAQVLRGVWLDSDLNNTPQPNGEVHSVVLRCGTLAEHAALAVPTCRQHWRPVMTVALKAHTVSGSMSNFVERAPTEHAGTRLGCRRVL